MKYILKNTGTGKRYIVDVTDDFQQELIETFRESSKHQVTEFSTDPENDEIWNIYCEKVRK